MIRRPSFFFLPLMIIVTLFFPREGHAVSNSYVFILGGWHTSAIDLKPDENINITSNISSGSIHIGAGIQFGAEPHVRTTPYLSLGLEIEGGNLFGEKTIVYPVDDSSERAEFRYQYEVSGFLRLNLHMGAATFYAKGGGGGGQIEGQNDTMFKGNIRGGGGAEFHIGKTSGLNIRIDYTYIGYPNIGRFDTVPSQLIGDEGRIHLIRAGFVQKF